MNLIGGENGVALYAETWLRRNPYTSGSVMNVEQVTVLGDTYQSTKDHSKYLVAERRKRKHFPQSYLVCIGDLNREVSTLCFLSRQQ